MYYATELFIKKGALGKIWLAGTIFKKLTKKAILESDIEELCKQVREPPVPLAISTCGRLTLGIVRIHDKIIHYLLIEANEAQNKLRRVLTRGKRIDLPQERLQARPEDITMIVPDMVDLDIDGALFEGMGAIYAPAATLEAPVADITLPDAEQEPSAIDRFRARRAAQARIAKIEQEQEQELEKEEKKLQSQHFDYDIQIQLQKEQDEPVELDLDLDILQDAIQEETQIPEPSVASVSVPSIPSIPPFSTTAAAAAGLITTSPFPPSSPIVPAISIPERSSLSVQEEITPVIGAEISSIIRRKKPQKNRFSKDKKIELLDEELLISDDQIENYLVSRPRMTRIQDRVLTSEEFDDILRNPFDENDDVYGFGSELNKILKDSMNNIIEGINKRIPHDEAIITTTSPLLPSSPPPPSLPSIEQIRRERESPIVDLGVLMQPIQDEIRIEEQEEKEIEEEEEKEIEEDRLERRLKRRRLNIGEEIISPEEESIDDRRRRTSLLPDLNQRLNADLYKEELEMESQSQIQQQQQDIDVSETTIARELTHLSEQFRDLIAEKIKDLKKKKKEEKTDLKTLLSENAQKNNTYVTRRDAALGFMQTIILKNADIIDISQSGPYQPIFITKGPQFNYNFI